MIGKISQPLHIKQYQNKARQQPSFGTNCRSYYKMTNPKDPYAYSCMETTTCMFRNDISWRALVKFITNHFQKAEKVQVLNPACSDGSEAYSFIMLLKEQTKTDANKFFPIYACDVDNEILKAAKSGLIQTTFNDRIKIKEHTKKYSKYLNTTEEQLNIQNDGILKDSKTLKVTDELKNAVTFKVNDLFNMLKAHKDNSNTFLMCRNVLGHLEDDKVKKFAKLASEKLNTKSVLAIGDFDREHSNIEEYLKENRFQKVLKNIYIKVDKEP